MSKIELLSGDQEKRFDLYEPLQTCIDEVISFNGKNQNYCVGVVDMVNSTKITPHLTKEKMCKYYGIFLNAMAFIAKKYDAVVIKNIGDSLLYYFPETIFYDEKALAKSLECGITMIKSANVINKKLYHEQLPPVSYRVSTDCGTVMLAKSVTSTNDDIFGLTVNLCTKINRIAKPNEMVVGQDLYQLTKSIDGYIFKYISSYSNGLRHNYPVYVVRRNIDAEISNEMIK